MVTALYFTISSKEEFVKFVIHTHESKCTHTKSGLKPCLVFQGTHKISQNTHKMRNTEVNYPPLSAKALDVG